LAHSDAWDHGRRTAPGISGEVFVRLDVNEDRALGRADQAASLSMEIVLMGDMTMRPR
jgi:hypothetical protein